MKRQPPRSTGTGTVVTYTKHFRCLVVKEWNNPHVDKITVGSQLAQSPNDRGTRLSAGECEACGDTDGPFEKHHPNRLKDKPRDQMKPWKESARRRRTIVLCHKCHVAPHGGRMTSGTERRVHSTVQARFGGGRWGVFDGVAKSAERRVGTECG